QLSEAVRDKETPAVFLISMREDFALNLNAFKGHLSNTLFENYYRLEKLELNEAKAAIEEPVKKVGFRYEEGLLDELLRDLAEQERENRIGSRKEIVPEQAPSFVEPPNVQIVCTQLWEEEQHNPDKTIRKQTYKQHAGAKGFIGSYFKKVIDRFSKEEKKIASKAFDHLVTPRGTKMAYPVKDLSDKLRVKETELDTVLAGREQARVLRSQTRKVELWYELYHDTFSGIIYRWNSDYKAKQRAKRYAIGGIIALLVLAALGILYDVTLNLTNYHLRLKILKEEPSHIELYRGKAGSWDLFGLQKYLKESAYNFEEIEPDKLFTASEPVGEYGNLTVELIQRRPLTERISAYWQAGKIGRVLELAEKSIESGDISRIEAVIPRLSGFHSKEVWDDLLKKSVADSDLDLFARRAIISALKSNRLSVPLLISLLDDPDRYIQLDSVKALGELGSAAAVGPLIERLSDQDWNVRSGVAQALGALGSAAAVGPLIERLSDQDSDVRMSV
ncbi:MAG: HEAT repeat domain-containing protein, partial [bacterium]|nr:HEAT repeat domain-containing protein [bacterium]